MKSFYEYYLEASGQDTEVDWSGLKLIKDYVQDLGKIPKMIKVRASLSDKEKTILDNADKLTEGREEAKKKLNRKYLKLNSNSKEVAQAIERKFKIIEKNLQEIEQIKKKYEKKIK
jgi:hypothetical protein